MNSDGDTSPCSYLHSIWTASSCYDRQKLICFLRYLVVTLNVVYQAKAVHARQLLRFTTIPPGFTFRTAGLLGSRAYSGRRNLWYLVNSKHVPLSCCYLVRKTLLFSVPWLEQTTTLKDAGWHKSHVPKTYEYTSSDISTSESYASIYEAPSLRYSRHSPPSFKASFEQNYNPLVALDGLE